MNYTIYTMGCNSATHATCPLTLTAYKYNELQMSSATQKLSCKASCKTPFFLIMYVSIVPFVYKNELKIELALANINILQATICIGNCCYLIL
jgi:hypothetical protein